MALEAVETCDGGTSWADPYQIFDPKLVEKAITAIKQALAAQHEPENEPFVSLASVQEPVQEPVAWMYPDDYERMTTSETFCTVYSVEVGSATRGESTIALCTTPPAAQPAVPDALTSADIQEHIEYVAGWNDCRAAMMEMMK